MPTRIKKFASRCQGKHIGALRFLIFLARGRSEMPFDHGARGRTCRARRRSPLPSPFRGRGPCRRDRLDRLPPPDRDHARQCRSGESACHPIPRNKRSRAAANRRFESCVGAKPDRARVRVLKSALFSFSERPRVASAERRSRTATFSLSRCRTGMRSSALLRSVSKVVSGGNAFRLPALV